MFCPTCGRNKKLLFWHAWKILWVYVMITFWCARMDTIDHLQERGVDRGSAWQSSIKTRQKTTTVNTTTVNQTNIGKVWEATLGDGAERVYGLSRARKYLHNPNWTDSKTWRDIMATERQQKPTQFSFCRKEWQSQRQCCWSPCWLIETTRRCGLQTMLGVVSSSHQSPE